MPPLSVIPPPSLRSLAASCGSYLFLRPPRFGKTQLLRALESFFIKDLAGKDDQPLPVVTLDFADLPPFTSRESFGAHFEVHLQSRFRPAGFVPDTAPSLNFFEQLRLWLSSQPTSSLVVLIDNYDAPLTACLADVDAFRAVDATLSKFFAILKSLEGRLRFLLLTGVLRLAGPCLQSELNYLTDLTHDAAVAELTGFTRESIERAFGSELQQAARTLCLTPDALLSELVQRYGGYRFVPFCPTPVLAPSPVLQVLEHPERGFPDLTLPDTLRHILSAVLDLPSDYPDAPKAAASWRLDAFQRLGSITPEALLTQAGLLTVERRLANGASLLATPNASASQALQSLCA